MHARHLNFLGGENFVDLSLCNLQKASATIKGRIKIAEWKQSLIIQMYILQNTI
jgi:hypothetical protein